MKALEAFEVEVIRQAVVAGNPIRDLPNALGRSKSAVYKAARIVGWQPKPPRHPRERHYRLYGIWSAMKTRCTNPRQDAWLRYGGRGISFCDEWKTFDPFMEWALASGYDSEMTLDRIDVNGNYEPSNCRWLPLSVNVAAGFKDRKRDGRGGCKLNTRQASEIKGLVGSGALTRAEASEVYDLRYDIIKRAVNGSRWVDVPPVYNWYAG